MIEVEAKIKIKNPEEFRKKISEIARLIKKEKKIDDYYTLESLKIYPKKSLRVRKTNQGYEINFKQHLSYVNGVHAKKEQEFKVTDIQNFLSLIKDFGFKKWLTKIKYSETYEISKNFHVEINNVKKLGWFIEIEYLAKQNEISYARTQVLKIIGELNLDKESIIKEGYTKLLWDKQQL